jgi:phosphoribosylanthranilate isomerase
MGIFVKICGVCSGEDARAVAELQPDAIGFVLWPKSKRAVKVSDVKKWVRDLPSTIVKVGVFVDQPPAQVRDELAGAGLDVAQLQGSESPCAFNDLNIHLWKAAYPGNDAMAALAAWHVDAFLVDTYSEEAPGGTGRVGDWKAARSFVLSCPSRVLLAGGLTPDNVAAAIREVGPWGVDVSSGVEEKVRKKDLKRVRAFIEQCRS